MCRRSWLTLALCLFSLGLKAQIIRGGGITLPSVPTLVIEQTHDGRTDLLSCNVSGGKRAVVDGNPYYTKAYVGVLSGRVIYVRSGYGSSGSYAMDLVSAKPDGTGQVVLAYGFTSAASPALVAPKVLLDTQLNFVVYEQTNWSTGIHDIYSATPDGLSHFPLVVDAREKRLKGLMYSRAIYELQWSATDIDLMSVVTDGSGRAVLSNSGDDETFVAAKEGQVFYYRQMGSTRTLWSCNPNGGLNTQMGSAAGTATFMDVRSTRTLFTISNGATSLWTQNGDSTTAYVVAYGVDARCGARFVGDYAVYASTWNDANQPTSLSWANLSGYYSPSLWYSESLPLTWTVVNGGTQVLVQSDNGITRTLGIQTPGGSGWRLSGADFTFLQEGGGRLIVTVANYRGAQTDLQSIQMDTAAYASLASSAFPESLGVVLDATVFYQMTQSGVTDLRRVYTDGTGNSDLWTVAGSARIVGSFY